jgi:hypothetical protein
LLEATGAGRGWAVPTLGWATALDARSSCSPRAASRPAEIADSSASGSSHFIGSATAALVRAPAAAACSAGARILFVRATPTGRPGVQIASNVSAAATNGTKKRDEPDDPPS